VATAVLITTASAALAQRGGETAAQNVRESQQYDQLVCSNPSFRAKRIAQECGPLQGSQFYDSCVASFQCGGPGAPHARDWRKAPASEMVR
jgi:hypothetical protein